MKRRVVHGAFTVPTLVLGAAFLVQLVALTRVERANDAIASVPATLTIDAAGTDVAGAASADPPVDPSVDAPARRPAADASEPPRARLARAVALAAGGETRLAEGLLVELARRPDDVGRAARFNLANGYLRQGLETASDPARARAIVELAKQRYRDLLKEDPDDWDARYNLERALRVAPEGDDRAERERVPPVKRVDVVFPGFEAGELP